MSIYLQYQNSPNLVNYIKSIEDNIYISATEFYNTYFNIKTCGTAGLDNWGIILNRPRTVQIPSTGTSLLHKMGFYNGNDPTPSGNYPQNFNYSNFVKNYGVKPFGLNNMQYRALLLFTYLNYVTNATLSTINANMNYYYNPEGTNGRTVAVTNTGPMEITYKFNFKLEPYEIILFANQGVLPTPICVEQILEYPTI